MPSLLEKALFGQKATWLTSDRGGDRLHRAR
jgi:hypothetical protein